MVLSPNMALTIGGMILNIVVLPTLLDKNSYIPRKQSIPSAVALTLMTWAYISISAFLPALATFIGVVLWVGVALYRAQPMESQS